MIHTVYKQGNVTSEWSETTLQTFLHFIWIKRDSLESVQTLYIVWEQMVCEVGPSQLVVNAS